MIFQERLELLVSNFQKMCKNFFLLTFSSSRVRGREVEFYTLPMKIKVNQGVNTSKMLGHHQLLEIINIAQKRGALNRPTQLIKQFKH